MKKKIFSILLLVCTLVCTLCISASAATSGKCGSNLNWSLSSGTLTISGTGAMYSYYDNGNTVPWNSSKSSITKIVIGEGVTKLDKRCFYYCTALTTLSLPSTLTTIPETAFMYCEKLESVTIPGKVKTIGMDAFYGCISMTKLVIESGVQEIGEDAFASCEKLSSITVPNTISKVDYDAFYGTAYIKDANNKTSDGVVYCGTICLGTQHNKTLKSHTIKAGTTCIAANAFYNCENLETISVPDSVLGISAQAFILCKKLRSVTIPAGVTEIPVGTFAYCESLETVENKSNKITSIGYEAFYDCRSLKGLKLPNTVKTIQDKAFLGCSSMVDFSIPTSVTSIGEEAFNGCSKVAKFVVPKGVTEIKYGTFSSCSGMKELHLPATLTSIADDSISSSSLEKIVVASGNPNYVSVDGVLFSKNMTTLYLYPASRDVGGSYTIPDGVKFLSTKAFYLSKISEVVIPESVYDVGRYVFYNSEVETVALKGVIKYTDGYMFRNCKNLKSFTYPEGTTKTGQYTFEDCTALETVVMSDSMQTIDYGAFRGCSALKNIVIPESVTVMNTYVFSGCTSLKDIVIPTGLTSIPAYAFYDCTALTDIYYAGDETAWAGVTVNNSSGRNDSFLAATVHYNYKLTEGMSLNQKQAKIKTEDALTLTATVTPADATDKTIVWSSSDENVVTVKDGVVTVVGEGIATVTATLNTQFGGIVYTDSCKISVLTEPEITAMTVMDMSGYGVNNLAISLNISDASSISDLYVASYDAGGRVKEIKKLSYDTNKTNLSATDVAEVKAFIWDADDMPLCNEKTITKADFI